MRIIYETGDVLDIGDNPEAGIVSGTVVKLLYRLSPGSSVWMVEVTKSNVARGAPERGYRTHCDEQYFQP